MDAQYADVRSLHRVLDDMRGQPGVDAQRSLIVGKAILVGSHDYAMSQHRYSTGGVAARRAEGICISLALEAALKNVQAAGLARTAVAYCDNGAMDGILQANQPSGQIMARLRPRLVDKKSDYREDRLTSFGERVLLSLQPRGYMQQADPRAPTRVALDKLDEYTIPPKGDHRGKMLLRILLP